MLRIHKRQPPAGTLLRFQNVQSLHRRAAVSGRRSLLQSRENG
ncbi:ORFL271C.iORF1 [Human betaherpesvirus 5]|nr:ORFL271C.iORF1 [Human betaherpesvirus 5]QHX40652.1 ORFL271C.iORF1 [Human betaherpesvirus 5]